ncbi:hypothetical protein [Stieleria marina]|uniref:Transmembrane protein n=1 Tax=Stieleria marina TaxID=1930275 RepID=A0A517NRG3_9BACT|nr:hypothetical protein K239x_16710 [Planctomycetes bacterium K23_9]
MTVAAIQSHPAEPKNKTRQPSRQQRDQAIGTRQVSTTIDSSAATGADPSVTQKSKGGYLFSPLIDWLFVANVLWPLVLLVDWAGGMDAHEGMLFWQIFFVTAPHRWITIVLVSVDHHRSQDRRWLFASLALVILGACLVVQFGTGSLLCLGLIDYVWNAWHFSSQHHGIFRIYQRKGTFRESKLAGLLRKALFRGFMLYVIARVAGFGWSDGEGMVDSSIAGFAGDTSAGQINAVSAFASVDLLMLAIPSYFVVTELARLCVARTAKVASVVYLISVMTLFTSMLMAAHFQNSHLVIQLAVASAIFHSMEYMSIVTWTVRKPVASPKENPLSQLSQAWFLFLCFFVVVIGVGNYILSLGFVEWWVTINLIVAFWHYCFDGIIWKRGPKPGGTPVPTSGT